MGKKIELLQIDQSKMTLGDLSDFEEFAKKPVQEVFKEHVVRDENGEPVRDEDGHLVKEARATFKDLIGLIWITQRRLDPEFTVEDARDVEVGQLLLIGEGDEPSPGNAEGGDGS